MSVELDTVPRPKFAKRLIGGTFNYGLGSILPQVIGFLLIPVYTTFLGPADLGILDLIAAFGAILVVLMRFGIPGAVTRFYFDHCEGRSLQDYVSTINRLLWGSSSIVGVLAFCLVYFTKGMILPGVPLAFTGFIVIISLLSSNTDLQRRLIQAREQSRYSAILSFSFALANIALAILFIAGFHWGVKGMLLAQLITGIVFFLQARYYLAPELMGSFQKDYVRPSLHYGLGILPSHLLAQFAPFFVRSVLASQVSLDAVGVLGLASRFTNPLYILFSALSTAFLPLYYAARKEGSKHSAESLARTVRNSWFVALFLFLAAVFLAPPAIEIMTPPRFHSAAPLVHVLAFGFLGQAVYLLLTPEIFYQKKTWMISLVSVFGVAVNISATILLVKSYGLTGVAWAGSLGQLAIGFLGGAFSLYIGGHSQHWTSLVRVTGVAMVIGLAMLLPCPTNPYSAIVVGFGLLAGFVVLTWTLGDPSIRDLCQFAWLRSSENTSPC